MHLRRAPEALTRDLIAALLAGAILIGCGRQAGERNVSVAWDIEPAPPVTGAETIARFTLEDAQRRRLRGARLQLDAHMSHPGMAPVVAAVAERADGTYEARLRLPMAGDWTLVVTGVLPDGSRITRQLELAATQHSP
jgi:hypothetical protein